MFRMTDRSHLSDPYQGLRRSPHVTGRPGPDRASPDPGDRQVHALECRKVGYDPEPHSVTILEWSWAGSPIALASRSGLGGSLDFAGCVFVQQSTDVPGDDS